MGFQSEGDIVVCSGGAGLLGNLPSIPVVDGGAAYVPFCSLERCSVSSHAKQKVPVESQKMGWYLEAGGSAGAGACLEIFFPAGSEGPIGESAEPLLVGERGDFWSVAVVVQWVVHSGCWEF